MQEINCVTSGLSTKDVFENVSKDVPTNMVMLFMTFTHKHLY